MSWRETLNVGQLFLGNKSIQVKGYEVEFTVGVEATDAINVAIQVNDPEGKAIDHAAAFDFYLADDAAGLDPSTTAPTTGTAIGTDGALIESVANLSGKLITEVDGDADVTITNPTTTPTFYLVIVLPDGQLAVSTAITFA